MGYFVRDNLDLVKYDGYRREVTYTDIDVFGVKYDEMFQRTLMICDCRTGTSSGNAERILNLAGLVVYMDSDKGLFVRDKVSESKYLEIAEKTKIQVLSLDH